ncbi:hypothetical protein C1646_766940 [Rhizophagus diaphanus]|nr:hypothetical protein C1646_766940 [Rhizophagus diaphanus] [Rhizophagus sp. MUCL 43196]
MLTIVAGATTLDQLLVIANDPRGVKSCLRAMFFEVMNTRFWEKPDDQFVQVSIGVRRTCQWQDIRELGDGNDV